MKKILLLATALSALTVLSAPAQTTADANLLVERFTQDPPAESRRTPVGELIRILSSVELRESESSRQIVLVLGEGKIDGEVQYNTIVVGGRVTINGPLRRDLVLVLSDAKLGPNAEIHGKTFVIGGKLERDPAAKVSRQPIEVGNLAQFPALVAFKDWLVQGLLLGRPLPTNWSFAWAVAGAFLLAYLLLGILFPKSAQQCVETLERQPVSAFLVGLLTIVVFPLACLLLSATGIGLLAVPFLFIALVVGALLGKLAVLRVIGHQVGRQCGVTELANPWLGFLLGAALLCGAYVVPILGLLAWAFTTTLATGAAALAVVAHLGREVARPEAGPGQFIPVLPADAVPHAVEAGFPRVGFWLRFVATLLDLTLVSLATALTQFPPLLPVFWLAYHVGLWTWKGTTLGGIVLGLKIVREDGRTVDFAVALVRSLSSVFSLAVLGLGFFWAGWSRDKRAWHDRIAGTIIVRVPRGISLI